MPDRARYGWSAPAPARSSSNHDAAPEPGAESWRTARPRAERTGHLWPAFAHHAGHRLRARQEPDRDDELARGPPVLVAAYPECGRGQRARGHNGPGHARARASLEVGEAPPFGPPPR